MSDKEVLLAETKELLEIADENTVRMVYAMLSVDTEKDESDWWNNMGDEQKQDLKTSNSQADNGQLHAHNEPEKIFEKWLMK